jgi:Asp/Glu/hydantoin racemase
MLDTCFPRIKGDIGNPDTFSYPVRKLIVEGAFPQKVIRENPETLLPLFVAAAIQLEKEGAFAITTSCGFLTLFQKELEIAVDIPVLASSLFLYNQFRSTLPVNKKLGILTIAASSLSPAHLASANIKDNLPIGTTENGEEFTSAILENRDVLDIEKARNDNVSAAHQLQKAHPDLGAILLECTNMPPYADAISKATGLPVFSILDGLNQLWREAQS